MQPSQLLWAPIPAAALSLALLISSAAAFGQSETTPPPVESSAATTGAGDEKAPEETQQKRSRKKRKKAERLSRKERRQLIEALPMGYKRWLEEVDVLLSTEERDAFLEIEQDYQRDAFIENFWRTRDPYSNNAQNAFRQQWGERVAQARGVFGDLTEDRARYFLLNGPPDARISFNCTTVTYPLEVWFYQRSERVGFEFFLIFYRRFGRPEFTLWNPGSNPNDLFDIGVGNSQGRGIQDALQEVQTCRDGDVVVAAIARLLSRPTDFEMLLAKIEAPAESPSPEWVATFAAYSTDLPPDAELLEGQLIVDFPRRYKTRTVLESRVAFAPENLEISDLAGYRSLNLYLTGEVLRDGKLFENFRYKFDLPVPEEGLGEETVPFLFERRLRPGNYEMVVKVEDLNSGKLFRAAQDLEVPYIQSTAGPLPDDPETRRILEQAEAAFGASEATVQIVKPAGQMQTGFVRFDTLTTGEGIAEIRFALNGRVVMQKRRAPYSVELDLGRVPRTHELRVSAHDENGAELTSDQIQLNSSQYTFSARLVEPTAGVDYVGSVKATAEVKVPEDQALERVELYLNETLMATLYQEPYVQEIPLPDEKTIAYVRAVAYLTDGNYTEDLVYVNAPDYLETVEIEYVELYVTARDRSEQPAEGLTKDDFTISEDGVAQEIRRFEQVENLPIHVQVMIDTSASMSEDIDQTKQAALEFFQTGIGEKDRGALITFNDHPHLAVSFTNEIQELAGGLAGLQAERGTALYDSLIFGLYHLNGLKGQRAMLLLSDGKDESSRFSYEDTLEFARRAGVAIYSIGLAIDGKGAREAKKKLTEIAEETGGRSFFLDDVSGLGDVYAQIQRELRSRYLLTYQSTNSEADGRFRFIELKALKPGVTAKTLRGYYP
ncbi:MAG: VWA domain-containing protein [Acidobacteriota bacterium]